ncbi:MAG: hypothetical protein QNK37_06375 [Acidobacteriota bacterium]|nr:hypothetical protein [Acidobacteriota bacterium]
MLSRQEKQFAQQMFSAKVALNDEATFARLFSGVMSRRENGFARMSLATGGGRGNGEAYCTADHHIYLLYGAHMVTNRSKTVIDMADLVLRSCPDTRSFFMVCNDRFRGAPEQLADILKELGERHPDIYFDIFLPAELADLFASLDDGATLEIIGPVPRPAKLVPAGQDKIARVVRRALALSNPKATKTRNSFDFERLGGHFPSLLEGASAFAEMIDPNCHPDLCRALKTIYNEGRYFCPEGENGNWIFCYMLDRLGGSEDPETQSAALAVLASCLNVEMSLRDSA